MQRMTKIATLVGCAIGDALGNPFEMFRSDEEELLQWEGQFKAGGTFWKGEAGQYTDDTLMSLALATSLVEHQNFNVADVADKYLAWLESGNTRGIGTTTASSLHRLKHGASYLESGLTHNPQGQPVGGNGTAMRVSPIGLVYRHDLIQLMDMAMLDASITHNSLEPKVGSAAVGVGIALLVQPLFNPDALPSAIEEILPESNVKDKLRLAHELIYSDKDPMEALALIGETGNMGYVPETVGSAFYCLGATKSFKEAVMLAIKCGGDTDTTAAVVGALAGTYYGLEGIPEEYHSVENFQLLSDLTDELMNIEI
jgi:ADP-ribosyl-[dinitrogen reductase] hydrolase